MDTLVIIGLIFLAWQVALGMTPVKRVRVYLVLTGAPARAAAKDKGRLCGDGEMVLAGWGAACGEVLTLGAALVLTAEVAETDLQPCEVGGVYRLRRGAEFRPISEQRG